MSTKRKICVVITARTSYTKINPVMRAIQKHPDLELQVICAGSALINRYGAVDKQIEKDGFTINERVHMIVEGESLLTTAKTTGLGMIEFASAYNNLQPDCVFVMADRYEQMAVSIPAAYMNIPLAHAQGGEVTGNIDEKVRHAITKLADLHFPATQKAHDWIIRMGENPEQVVLSGCPSTDLCREIVENPDLNFNLYEKYTGVGAFPELDNGYIIVMLHPVTTEYGDAREQAVMTLEAVHELNVPTLWFWPNIDAGNDQTSKAIRVFREHNESDKLHFIRNMEPRDFLQLLKNASAIVGNSSCAIREASFLGTAAVNIGSRQSDRERADNVMNVNYNKEEIKSAILQQIEAKYDPAHLYGDGYAGQKIAEALATQELTFHKRINYLDAS